MCNSMEAITERVKKVMDDHGLSSAQMADRIGVQRSAISHILSGRNKPSLDFILKVLKSFSDVSSDWLLKGEKVLAETTNSQPQIQSKSNVGKTIDKVLILYTDKTVEEYVSIVRPK
ncbi:MAG: helix-turn-helix transcriptional regulator [Flavobacteriales bacterium]|nr:helix-turn-helix transcriptional regulator [Flavobacteriales bacterium]